MKLVSETDNILTTTCSLFTDNPADWHDTFEQMYQLMVSTGGIGLAANQVGIDKAFFLLKRDDSYVVAINPEIVEFNNEPVLMDEGCLSFRGLYLKVKRHDTISVKYTNQKGEQISEQLTGLLAQCFQHELEHLQGIVFTSKVSKLALGRAKEKRSTNLKKLGRNR